MKCMMGTVKLAEDIAKVVASMGKLAASTTKRNHLSSLEPRISRRRGGSGRRFQFQNRPLPLATESQRLGDLRVSFRPVAQSSQFDCVVGFVALQVFPDNQPVEQHV